MHSSGLFLPASLNFPANQPAPFSMHSAHQYLIRAFGGRQEPRSPELRRTRKYLLRLGIAGSLQGLLKPRFLCPRNVFPTPSATPVADLCFNLKPVFQNGTKVLPVVGLNLYLLTKHRRQEPQIDPKKIKKSTYLVHCRSLI